MLTVQFIVLAVVVGLAALFCIFIVYGHYSLAEGLDMNESTENESSDT